MTEETKYCEDCAFFDSNANCQRKVWSFVWKEGVKLNFSAEGERMNFTYTNHGASCGRDAKYFKQKYIPITYKETCNDY